MLDYFDMGWLLNPKPREIQFWCPFGYDDSVLGWTLFFGRALVLLSKCCINPQDFAYLLLLIQYCALLRNGYSLFTVETLHLLTDMPNIERLGEVSRRWKKLTEDKREAYNLKAEEVRFCILNWSILNWSITFRCIGLWNRSRSYWRFRTQTLSFFTLG